MARPITVLAAISRASLEIGLAQRPATTALGSLDQDVVQLTALLSAVAEEVLDNEPYSTTLGDGCWLMSADGATAKSEPTRDDDVILFDARLAVTGLKFRFLKAKGLEFGEDLRDFTARMNKLASRVNARVLDLDAEEGRVL